MIKKYKYLIAAIIVLLLLFFVLIFRNNEPKSIILYINFSELSNNFRLNGKTLSIFNGNDTIYLKKLSSTINNNEINISDKQNFISVDSLIEMISEKSEYFFKKNSEKENYTIEIIKTNSVGKDSVFITKPVMLLSNDNFYK